MSSRTSFYVIDASSLIYKVFHGTPMKMSHQGFANNAIGGVINSLQWLFRQHKIDHIASAWGSPEKTHRHELFPAYKAKRSPMPQELKDQLPYIKRVFEAFKIPLVSSQSHESDDVIATLACTFADPEWDVTIYSSDKDFRQLLSDRIIMFDHRHNRFVNAEDHYRDWGIRCDQVVDFLALTGDVVDGIPGVQGIGKTYAKALISAFNDLETLLESDEGDVYPKRHRKIKEDADQARLCRELVRLRTDAKIDITHKDTRYQWDDLDALIEISRECGLWRNVADFENLKMNRG
jgi:DNA polymerase-1